MADCAHAGPVAVEDAVAPDAKEEARENIVEEIQKGGYGYRELVIRCDGHALARQPSILPVHRPAAGDVARGHEYG